MPVLSIPERNTAQKDSSEAANGVETVRTSSKMVRMARNREVVGKMLEMMRKGYSVTEMSKDLGLTYRIAHKLFITIRNRMHREQSVSVEHLCSFVASKYDMMVREYYEAWDNSKRDKDGKRKEPNPVFMQGIQDTLRELRKLMGLDKFKEQAAQVTNNNSVTQQVVNWDSLLRTSKVIQAEAAVTHELDSVEDKVRQIEALPKSVSDDSDTVPAQEPTSNADKRILLLRK